MEIAYQLKWDQWSTQVWGQPSTTCLHGDISECYVTTVEYVGASACWSNLPSPRCHDNQEQVAQLSQQNCRLWGPLGRLRGNVGCSSQARWKALTELLSVIIELFSLAPTAESLRANIEWKSPFLKLGGSVQPKISGRRGHPPPTILCVRKTTWIYLSCGIRISAELSFVLSQFTRVTDRRTDTFAVGKTTLHVCSAVKINFKQTIIDFRENHFDIPS